MHRIFISHCVSGKVPTFKLSVTLSSINRFSKFLHCRKAYEIWNPYDSTHLTLGTLLHYLGKLKFKFSADIQHIWKKVQTNCILLASNFIIRPQILIFSIFKIATCSPYWLQVKFSMSLFFDLFTFVINLWRRKFITADVTAMFVNNQRCLLYTSDAADE